MTPKPDFVIWRTRQPSLCSCCGRLLIPNEDFPVRFKNKKNPRCDLSICPQCCLSFLDGYADWHVERNLPGK